MMDKPALTLLHLGPGFGNGSANLHNARRARTPIINMIGEHATYHRQFDAPLTADIEGFARPVSNWVGISESPENLANVGLEALDVAKTYPGKVASFITPADHAWTELTDAPAGVSPTTVESPPRATEDAIEAATAALQKARKQSSSWVAWHCEKRLCIRPDAFKPPLAFAWSRRHSVLAINGVLGVSR